MFSYRSSRKLHSKEQKTGRFVPYVLCSRPYCIGLCLIAVCVLTAAGFVCINAFAGPSSLTEVSLYFVDAEELKLVAERRTIIQAENTVEQIKLTVVELAKGPKTALMPVIPEETSVQQVFLDEKGCAYVDFSRELSRNHPGGTTGELVTVSSIVIR